MIEAGVDTVDGVVMDIGVSSMQLDQAERGFSFSGDGPLDMRMSQDGMSAADFVNEADEAEIADVLYLYGEERQSRRVARAIVAARPLTTTGELADVVRKALGYNANYKAAAGCAKDPGDAQLPGDPHPHQPRARRAGRGAGGRRNAAARRRAAGGGSVPQPGGPHRQALPARCQRSSGGHFAPSAADR